MKLSTFDMLRVWAMLTGVVLALVYFGALGLGVSVADGVALLVVGIGGFELMLFAQDVWQGRMRQNG